MQLLTVLKIRIANSIFKQKARTSEVKVPSGRWNRWTWNREKKERRNIYLSRTITVSKKTKKQYWS